MLDSRNIWYPCGQPFTQTQEPPLMIEHAKGSYLFLENGEKILDGISSWWCKNLGHNHPRLKAALLQQANRYEHAIHANTSCKTLESLAEKLSILMPGLNKVFFAGDGSCAVEIAMKLSLHARQLAGNTKRNTFIALQQAYHGETCGALSISDLGKYKAPYADILFETHFIGPLPYVQGRHDPKWNDCSAEWPPLEKQLQSLATTATALVVEPIVQGAAGMQVYSADLLRRLRHWCKQHDVHLIADEIMTGLGRTGLPLACQHADIIPDFVLLSKGLTSGWMPFSAVLIKETLYDLFVERREGFWHSHTFSGNPLAANIALACLQTLEDENIYQQVLDLEALLLDNMMLIANNTGQLTNIRGIGGIVAADVASGRATDAAAICRRAVELGVLLRPLDKTIYWCPPLNSERDEIELLRNVTKSAILNTNTT